MSCCYGSMWSVTSSNSTSAVEEGPTPSTRCAETPRAEFLVLKRHIEILVSVYVYLRCEFMMKDVVDYFRHDALIQVVGTDLLEPITIADCT